MFDKYSISPTVERTTERLVPYTKTVHEHRAPTDESIKIYDEMLEKARAAYVASVKVSTPFEINIEVYKDHYRKGYEAHYHTIINGEEYSDKVEVELSPMEYMDQERMCVDKLLQNIYTQILGSLVMRCMQTTRYEFTKYRGL